MPLVAKDEDQEIFFLTGTYAHLPDLAELRNSAGVELDLGCGVGSYTAELAMRHPERLIMAADVMIGRLRKAVKRAQREKLSNMRFYRTEARQLLTLAMPDKLLDRLHLLCPDPWPKGRHRGNRLLTSDFVAQLHRVLKDDGIFHFSSDDEYYFDAVSRVLHASGLFAEVAPCTDLSGVRSDFENRWLSLGKEVRHIYFRRLPLPLHTIGH